MSNRIEEIRKRAEKATPGPWTLIGDPPTEVLADYTEGGQRESLVVVDTRFFQEATNERELEDAAFIAYAREDIPYLLARIEELEAVIREVRRHIYEEPMKPEYIDLITAKSLTVKGPEMVEEEPRIVCGNGMRKGCTCAACKKRRGGGE